MPDVRVAIEGDTWDDDAPRPGRARLGTGRSVGAALCHAAPHCAIPACGCTGRAHA